MLEPDEGKLSSPVLRGLSGRKAARLPGEANGTTVPVSLDLGSSLSIRPSEGSRSRVRRTRGAKVQMAWQRSNPINPRELAGQSSSEFSDPDEAISAFIGSEWPKGIDGIALSPQYRP